jgi:hypothetical protein
MIARQEILSCVSQSTEPSTQLGVSAPILISEPEVAFSTAAAAPVRLPKTWRWAAVTAVVLAAWHRMVLTLTPEDRGPRRYCAKRYDFLEHACMAREMDRL